MLKWELKLEEDEKKYDLRRGLLFGYPHDSVVNYDKNQRWERLLFHETHEGMRLCAKKKEEIRSRMPESLNAEAFEIYKTYFLEVFKSLGVDISGHDYAILHRRQPARVNGIGDFVWVGNISAEDFHYCKAINSIFHRCGAYDYIVSCGK